MIDIEVLTHIRRRFFPEPWNAGTIASLLEAHPHTVLRTLGAGAFNRGAGATVNRPEHLPRRR